MFKILNNKYKFRIHKFLFPNTHKQILFLENKLREQSDLLSKNEETPIGSRVDPDLDWDDKVRLILGNAKNFGEFDFADLASWIFASSLSNHRVVHQRIDEASALWRAVKSTDGPILEIGRAAGGSTLILLAASSNRQVVSIDRAPFEAWCAKLAFMRDDVKKRLKLYTQTSRVEIIENNFGLIFIDADHSYEGVCHDIAMFWNKLKPVNGKKPLMAFHDGASNPITFVEPVHQACTELLSNTAIARKIESWGSMLVVEKLADINPEDWFSKQHKEFWQQFNSDVATVFDPLNISNRITLLNLEDIIPSENTLGSDNFEDGKWRLVGLDKDELSLNADSPVRLLRESQVVSEHKLFIELDLKHKITSFTLFIRPLGIENLNITIGRSDCVDLSIDLNLYRNDKINYQINTNIINLYSIECIFQSGYFKVTIIYLYISEMNSILHTIACKNNSNKTNYMGNRAKGLFFNLATLSYLDSKFD